ncbi:MAG: ATP-dependent DNA helicase RecQ [Muribaculaceae bacterium]
MNQLINDILKQYWGYSEFRELQEEIISSVLNGNDTLGLLPTGGGKSITFQVPTLAIDGMALVVTPIISLMKDQVDNLLSRGIKATYLHSGLSMSEMRKAIDNCCYGSYKFLYISPERLNSASFIDQLRFMKITLIVVDEAHCISQWGYDFRPSYLSIAKVRDLFPLIPVLALTATATPEVVTDIMSKLEFKNGKLFSKSFRRTNLSYVVRHTDDKIHQLVNILNKIPGSGIVYVRSRKKAKEIANELNFHNIPADFYHAGIANEDKNEKQNKWKNDECRIIVATNAFGMGIDKPNVRVVVHIDAPSSLEEYYQEAGRAGRDGNKSYVVLLTSNTDKATLKRRINDAFPPKDFIKEVYERVGNYLQVPIEGGLNEVFDFDFNMFCKTFKYPINPTFNALKILTQSGYIDFIEEIETQSRVIILAKKEELYHLSSDNQNLDKVLQAILRNYTGLFADYVYISEPLISRRYGISQEIIYESLLSLTKMHILHYVPRKRTPYISYTTSRELQKYILIPKKAYEDRKLLVERRINAVLNYAFVSSTCRESNLLEYFGEINSTPCGNCDVCLATKRESRHDDIIHDAQEGIMYMLSLKTRTLDDFLDTLSFSKDDIIEVLRFLLSEGDVILTNENKYKLR